jgi:hypothetical protein
MFGSVIVGPGGEGGGDRQIRPDLPGYEEPHTPLYIHPWSDSIAVIVYLAIVGAVAVN